METSFTPLTGLLGGLLIGSSALLLLWANGRIAGISGIVGGLISPQRGEVAWRLTFVLGMLIAAFGYGITQGGLEVQLPAGWPTLAIAGAIVGFGTRLGSGCTSGHGVCGIGRLSSRSLTATAVFMASAGVTVYLIRHVFGGAA
ncbi:MAG: YeeE/YedE family protein [Algiphilus sp.]